MIKIYIHTCIHIQARGKGGLRLHDENLSPVAYRSLLLELLP